MSGDDKKAKPALIAALAIASFGTMVLLPRAQAQPAPAPQCTPEEKKDLEMKLVCEAIEAGEAGASTALKDRLEKLNEFVKDVNPVLKKWFGTALPEDLESKINIDAASRYCRAQKGQAESFLEDEAKRVEAELDRCGMRI